MGRSLARIVVRFLQISSLLAPRHPRRRALNLALNLVFKQALSGAPLAQKTRTCL